MLNGLKYVYMNQNRFSERIGASWRPTAFLTPPICYNSRGAISSILPPPADFAGFGAFAIYRLFIGTMIYADISYDDGQNVFCS